MAVTDLSEYRQQREAEESPHIAGTARCLGCGHEWAAVTIAGEYAELECPACETYRGVMKATCAPVDGVPVFMCGCGCDVFRVTPDGVMCLLCGTTAGYDQLAE